MFATPEHHKCFSFCFTVARISCANAFHPLATGQNHPSICCCERIVSKSYRLASTVILSSELEVCSMLYILRCKTSFESGKCLLLSFTLGQWFPTFLYRSTLLNSLNFRGTPITKHDHFLLIKPFCYKIIKNKEDQIKGILFM